MSGDLSIYCKAYLLQDLRRFPEWHDARVLGDSDKSSLNDEAVVFIHPDFNVTATIYAPENVAAPPSPSWIAFCKDVLQFSVPEDLMAQASRDAGEQ